MVDRGIKVTVGKSEKDLGKGSWRRQRQREREGNKRKERNREVGIEEA